MKTFMTVVSLSWLVMACTPPVEQPAEPQPTVIEIPPSESDSPAPNETPPNEGNIPNQLEPNPNGF